MAKPRKEDKHVVRQVLEYPLSQKGAPTITTVIFAEEKRKDG